MGKAQSITDNWYFKTMILRGYQLRAQNAILAGLQSNPLLVMPTGSGKTVTAAAIVKRVGVPTLWLAHRKELIAQAARQIESFGFCVGIIMSGYAPIPLAYIQVGSVQTVARRDKPGAGLIIIDEAHHATADTYRGIIDAYPGVPRVGLTATPFRMDGRGLGDLFGQIITATTTRELCETGTLHSPKVWASKSPDLRGVKVVAGDYSLGALSKRTNDPALNADIVETWLKHASDKRSVCFACDVDHSQAIVDAFKHRGVAAEHLDGSTSRDDRDSILSRLAAGQTHVVSNCMVLTEGWDLPSLECAIVARPTASLNLHLQMIGRVMRACVGKSGAIVLDHAGNHHIHGLVTRGLKYSLDGTVRVGHDEPLGIKRCRQCGLMYDVGLQACPECGYAHTADSNRESVAIKGSVELSEFDDSSFEYRRQIWNLIEAERQAMGYKDGWSVFRFNERFGEMPVVAGGELIDAQKASMDQKREIYGRLVSLARSKGFKDGFAAHRFKEFFGHWPRGFVSTVRADRIRERWAGRAAA